jgi:hypothetical protein
VNVLRRGPRPPGPLSPTSRRGLFGVGLALTVALVGSSGLVAVNAMARQTVQEEHTHAFHGAALSVDVAVGEVQIVPGKPGEITVRRRLTYGLQRPWVEERVDDNTFRVSDRDCAAPQAFPCHIRWLLQVPRELFVEVHTRDGAITVSGLSGTVKLTSESGAVKALAPSGPLVTLRSHDGMVTAANASSAQVVATSDNRAVSLTFRLPPSLVVARSQAGPVGVLLPDGDDAYRISAQTQGGSRTVTARNDPEAHRRIDIRSIRGDISVLQSPES